MKVVIASDLHGSATWTRVLMRSIENEAPDRVALLGDLLYHGPRNPLPEGYAPEQVAYMLNGIAQKVVAVRGNCDAEVDQMVLDFPCMADYALLIDGCRTLLLTHGHVPGMTLYDLPTLPTLPQSAAFVFGHSHVKMLEHATLSKKTDAAKTNGMGEYGHTFSSDLPSSVALDDSDVHADTTPSVDDDNPYSDVVLVNPGSVALPKDDSRSYAVYKNGVFFLKTLEGKTLKELDW